MIESCAPHSSAPPLQAALAALAPCDSTSLILNDGRCPGETERQRHWRLLWWRWSPWVLLASAALACLPFLALLPPLRAAPRLLRRVCSRRDVGMEAPLLDV